jgi:hypothetical protein
MEQNCAVLEYPKEKKSQCILKKIEFSDLSMLRMVSLREAISDFVSRSKSPDQTVDSIWNLIVRIVTHQIPGDFWLVLDRDSVLGYFVTNICQEMDGSYSILIVHGWAHKDLGMSQSQEFLQQVVDDAMKRGASRIWFMTRRNGGAFDRWLGSQWNKVGTVFERRKLCPK